MQKTKRIFLTGFMGSGKTTIGKGLASMLGFAFYDMDDLIEEDRKQSIPEIFATYGSEYFRRAEFHILRELMSNFSNQVVATGGGTPCYYNNMAWMNYRGITVYLQMPPKALTQRLKNQKAGRPLIAEKTNSELEEYITQTLAQREPIYRHSHLILQGLNLTAKQAAEAITPYLNKK